MLASFNSEASFTPDDGLVLSPTVSRQITLVSGQNLKRGAVLGKVPSGAATSAVKAGGNTGNGTNVVDATTPVLSGASDGVYQVRVITAGANSATFRLTDPSGRVLGDYAFNGSGASVTIANQIKTVITDGATDFIVGDGFDISVATGAGKYKLAATAATDGSQIPAVILSEDCDATSADKVTVAYFGGTFDENACTYGTGHTAATAREHLRTRSILLQSSITR